MTDQPTSKQSPSQLEEGRKRQSFETAHSSTSSQDHTRVNTPTFDESTNPNQEKKNFISSNKSSQPNWDPTKLEAEESPLNWPSRTKWIQTSLAGAIFFTASFASSSANSASMIYQEVFGINHVVATLVLSLFILAYVFGATIWAPLSEARGRKFVNLTSLFLQTCFHMACALVPNFPGLLILRFLVGLAAAAPLSNSGANISDMFEPKDRLWPMTTYAITAFLSPALGPIAGGAMADVGFWREIYWLNCAMAGTLFLTVLIFQKETYAPVLLSRKRQSQVTTSFSEKLTLPKLETKIIKQILQVHMLRPLRLLFTEAPVMYAALWSSFCYSTLFIFFEAYPVVFGGIYGFNGLEIGLSFLGLVVGIFLTIPILGHYNNVYLKARKEAGVPVPEQRLNSTILSAPCYVVGFLWFGWTSRESIHFIVPILGTIPIGSGLILGFTSLATYTVEVYLPFAASALAALAISRSLFAFAFPLFSTQFFQNLGPGWACSILALFSLLVTPVPFIFNRYGIRIRQRSNMSIKD